MLKILSWNIQHGGGTRVKEILKFLQKSIAQVIVLSEFRNNKNGIFIRNKLLELGYTFQFVSLNDSDTNSVLIASKLACNSRLFVDRKLAYDHAVIGIEFPAFRLYGVYLPHKKKHQLFDLLQEELVGEKPSILLGDFNTGVNQVDQKGDSFWYTAELKRLEKIGMQDAFRYLHDDVEVYSWYSHQGNGYRYDHIYAHTDLLPLIKECDYIHKAREEKWSDHSPMILKF